MKLFFEKLAKDEALQLKMLERGESYQGDKEDERQIAEHVLISLAEEEGYFFTWEEYNAAIKSTDEMSDEELEHITAGWVLPWHKKDRFGYKIPKIPVFA